MRLKPEGRLLGLREALTKDGIAYSEIKMASLQRGYEWEDPNWKALFGDTLREATKSYPSNYGGQRGPFIGVFILTELEQGRDAGDQTKPYHCEVVDGQQRVTTSFIFAAIIRDHLAHAIETISQILASSDGVANGELRERLQVLRHNSNLSYASIQNLLEYEWPNMQRTRRLRTWAYLDAVVDRGIYTNGYYTTGEKFKAPFTQGQTKKFARASNGLNELVMDSLAEVKLDVSNQHSNDSDVDAYVIEAQIEHLRMLYNVLTERMFVVKLSTPDIKDAGEVFLSLNSKGKSLSTKDIVKAALLDLHGETNARAADFASKWEKLGQQVGDLDGFLRLAWMTRNGTRTIGKNVAVEVTEYLDEDPNSAKQKANDLASEFFRFGNVIQSFTAPSIPASPTFTESRLLSLADTGSAYRFLLLPFVDSLSDGPDSAGKFDEVVRLLYTLSFTWKTKFDLPQALEDFYFELGRKFRKPQAGDPITELKQAVSFCVQNFVAGQQSNGNALILLHALEEAWREKHGTKSIGWKYVHDSVEHTAPQKPTTEWQKALNPGSDPDCDYASEVLFIGNLAVLNRETNSGIQRKPWEDPAAPLDFKKSKRAAFKNGEYFTTQHLAEVPAWDLEIIKARTRWVEEMILKVFEPFSGARGNLVKFYDWYLADQLGH